MSNLQGHRHGDLVAHKSERTGKRLFAAIQPTRSARPAARSCGKLEKTDEVCPTSTGAAAHSKGPGNFCPNYDCPGKEKENCLPRRGALRKSTKSTRSKAAWQRMTVHREVHCFRKNERSSPTPAPYVFLPIFEHFFMWKCAKPLEYSWRETQSARIVR